MVKLLMHAGRCSGRYLALAALTTTLVACGGSSGDSAPVDSDGDGFPRGEGPDADEDGILDVDDDNVDLDGDGFDDIIGAQDLDGDMIANKDDSDADGDGIEDVLDPFVDLNGDNLDDLTGEPEVDPVVFTDVSAANPCGGDTVGTDNNSSDADWGNNCLINRVDGAGDGQFATSLYAAGIQRAVFCAGFGGTDGQTYTAFADGIYGPNSEAAVVAFQDSDSFGAGLVADGEVGPQTWGALQDSLELLEQGQQQENGSADVQDSYGFSEGRCAGTPLFYQTIVFNADTQTNTEGGWSLAKNAPNTAQTAPFSIDPPGGQLD
ncbi:MAG: peptidoglycan-binding protein [Granulosicoccus sp.]